MIRHAVVVAVACWLMPHVGSAQTRSLDGGTADSNSFTVSAQSAAVRKAPSTGSPVIGQAPRGAILEVTRDIGAWVKITWPDAEDGVGYVHQSMGSLSKRSTVEERVSAAFTPAPEAPQAQVADPTTITRGPGAVPMAPRTVYVSAPTHNIGFGGRMASTKDSGFEGFGVTSRIWARSGLGVQVDALRSTLTSTTASGTVTASEFTPSAIYSLRDWVTDNIWLRPYVGGSMPITRSTWKSGTPDGTNSTPDTSIGYRAFGGAEFTLPAIARFAISADLGYRWFEAPFAGFDQNGMGFTVAAHWYVK